MRKRLCLAIVYASLVIIIFGTAITLVPKLIYAPNRTDGEYQGLRWIREESFFVDYSISKDIVQFRYSICLDNTSGHDLVISSVTASFKTSEMDGWLDDAEFFLGRMGDGQYEVMIPDGEKINVIVVFEGKYLGGVVNENLSNPVELMFSQRFAKSVPSSNSPS